LSNNPNLGDMVGEDVDVNIKKLDAHDVAKYVTLLTFVIIYKIHLFAATTHSYSVLCPHPGTIRQYAFVVDSD